MECTTTDEVVVAAEARLRRSGYLELHRIRCLFCDGGLTLVGHVSSYYLKQWAQCLIQGLPQVERIDNQLMVPRPGVRKQLEGA